MKLHKSITNLLDTNYDIHYVDRYYDPFDNNEEELQDAIHSQNKDCLEDFLQEQYWEITDSNMGYIFEDIKMKISERFNVSKNRASNFLFEYAELFEKEIYSRDCTESNFVNDCLSNYGQAVMFYDLGSYIYSEDHKSLDLIKSILDIKDESYDEQIVELLNNSYGGGRICIYFSDYPEKYMDIKGNTINFENPHLVLFDNINGSGYDVFLKGHNFSASLNVNNIFIDKVYKYNYTYAVCGMTENWCKETSVKFTTTNNIKF